MFSLLHTNCMRYFIFILQLDYPPCSSVTPNQWSSFSNENILKTEKECNASSTLRGVIHGVLEQTLQDIHRQRVTVNIEFSKRIYELNLAKKALQDRLEKVSFNQVDNSYFSRAKIVHGRLESSRCLQVVYMLVWDTGNVPRNNRTCNMFLM